MFRRFTRSIATVASVAVIGLFAIPEVAHAANVELTITDSSGAAIPRAMVAVLNSDGDAVDSAIADASGKVTIDDTNAASIVVAANGYQTKVVTPVAAGTVTLTASTKSKLSYSNAYGGQIRPNGLAADAESGVFYATTDAQPSVWRTTDYAGTWAPVPTSADSTEATAAAAGALPQETANEIFTSAVPGEVAVNTNQALFFSRNYGNTWTKIDNYGTATGTSKKHFWVHGGTNGDSSIIFVRTNSGLFAAVVPDSAADTAAPSFVNVTSTLGSYFAAGDDVAFAVGKSGGMFMLSVNGSGTKLAQLSLSGNTISATAAAQNVASLNSHSLTRTGDTLVKLSTLGGDTPKAFVTHSGDGSTTLSVGHFDGTIWDISASNAIIGTDQADSLNLSPYSAIQGKCGHNGNTALVGSIVNDLPTSGEILFGAEVVGTIGQCMFLYNGSGGAVTLGSVSIADDKVAVLPMGGANNNTGFAWDAGFNFSSTASTGNMVSLTGDGKFGIRKSAVISDVSKYRPQFGSANPTTIDLVKSLAAPGKDTLSGGVAVTGLSGPNVTDVVYDPNSTDGSRMVLSMTDTGGGRTMISTDGGTSFSTLGAGGSRSVDWWNGADGKQHIAATFTLGADYLQVKSFKTSTGDGALDMGDELAATAAVRDAREDASRKLFSFGPAVTPAAGGQLRDSNFIPSGGTLLNTAIEGIVGKDMMLMAVNKCSDNVGPTGCTGSAASVGLLNLSVNATSGNVTASSIKYFGSEADANGVTTAPNNGTYTAGVSAIQYCPVGSAAKVADTAFISVSGKGLYKISAVTTSPKHEVTGTTTGTYSEMKVDCDTGLIGVAGATGLFMSIDGGAKFFELKTGAAQQNQPNPPSGGQGGGTTALAVQADATTGDVTVAVGSGNGDVKSIETTFTDMGLKGSEVAAGTATSPTAAVTPKTDQINEVNNSSSGKNTGAVPDLELPPAAGDKVSTSATKILTVRASATAGVKLAVGTAGGAFKATVKNGSITAPSAGGAPAAGAPTAQPAPTVGAPAATAPKVAMVGVKKTATVLAQLKTLGISVVAKSKLVTTTSTKSVCSVVAGTKVKGLKAGVCRLTVQITPPPTKKVPKPKTTTKRITVTIK